MACLCPICARAIVPCKRYCPRPRFIHMVRCSNRKARPETTRLSKYYLIFPSTVFKKQYFFLITLNDCALRGRKWLAEYDIHTPKLLLFVEGSSLSSRGLKSGNKESFSDPEILHLVGLILLCWWKSVYILFDNGQVSLQNVMQRFTSLVASCINSLAYYATNVWVSKKLLGLKG